MSEDLKELRVKIDSIDAQLVDLFKQRMAVSRDIAAYKKEHSMPTLDAGRERALLAKVGTQAGEELAEYTESVFRSILAAGRSYQNQCSGVKSQVYETIRRALDTTPELFPQRAVVACQGIEGAYSQIACDSIFKSPSILYFNTFEHLESNPHVHSLAHHLHNDDDHMYILYNHYNFSDPYMFYQL